MVLEVKQSVSFCFTEHVYLLRVIIALILQVVMQITLERKFTLLL